ncbi:MAG: hypothetical protein LLG02_04320 [Pelosinus sp.]|nr:hypothetical protein [Pelosinus sp.]
MFALELFDKYRYFILGAAVVAPFKLPLPKLWMVFLAVMAVYIVIRELNDK